MKNPIIGITTDVESEDLRLKHNYCDAVIEAGGVPILIPPLGNTIFYAEMINGLLIPGGDDLDPSYYHEEMLPQVKPVPRRRSNFEISLLKEVVNLHKPVLGICYGMQLINVVFGGTLYQDIDPVRKKALSVRPVKNHIGIVGFKVPPKISNGVDSQMSVEINHKKGYHITVITENRFLKKGTFFVNSTHHQAIRKLGIGLSVFAYSEDNMIEAFYKEDYKFLIGVQWHPERLLENELSLSLFKSFVEASYDNK